MQNAWLKYNSGVSRGAGVLSRHNPAIALVEKPLHKRIGALQRKYGLFQKEVLLKQSALTNINRNAAITRRVIMEFLPIMKNIQKTVFIRIVRFRYLSTP
ncbi:hypothetical protein LMZ02_17505 [Paenibacillus macerans]|uniref:hypothetical protein n=1 Tax=Paenibacillus macerans TaxID=44252 RepID=UPI001F111361|nr:hypothetical protein [Paenibacillus macerans]MBS5914375.1 hypothetical protein [Paenibacillus macerans]UMV45326.1 hypothetical protein LMZ02_17505 [Paenibacillus macerans]